MKIAIDLNDVVRDFTYNFLMYYVKGYNHQYDPDDFNESTNDMELALPFKTTRAYEKFVYLHALDAYRPVGGHGVEV